MTQPLLTCVLCFSWDSFPAEHVCVGATSLGCDMTFYKFTEVKLSSPRTQCRMAGHSLSQGVFHSPRAQEKLLPVSSLRQTLGHEESALGCCTIRVKEHHTVFVLWCVASLPERPVFTAHPCGSPSHRLAPFFVFTDFYRGRERERERDTNVRERNIDCCLPYAP